MFGCFLELHISSSMALRDTQLALNHFSGSLIDDEGEGFVAGSDGNVSILKFSLEMNLHLLAAAVSLWNIFHSYYLLCNHIYIIYIYTYVCILYTVFFCLVFSICSVSAHIAFTVQKRSRHLISTDGTLLGDPLLQKSFSNAPGKTETTIFLATATTVRTVTTGLSTKPFTTAPGKQIPCEVGKLLCKHEMHILFVEYLEFIFWKCQQLKITET